MATDSGRMSCAHCGFSFNVLAMTMALSTVPGGGTVFSSLSASVLWVRICRKKCRGQAVIYEFAQDLLY